MLYLVEGNIGTQVQATITSENDGSVVDLSGATVVMKFRAVGSNTILFTLTAISTTSSGTAVFQFGSGDLDLDEGRYEAEIEATFENGRVETVYEKVEFYLRADF